MEFPRTRLKLPRKTNNIFYRRQTFYKLVSGLVRRIIRRHFARNTPRACIRLINTANLFSPPHVFFTLLIKNYYRAFFDKSLIAPLSVDLYRSETLHIKYVKSVPISLYILCPSLSFWIAHNLPTNNLQCSGI